MKNSFIALSLALLSSATFAHPYTLLDSNHYQETFFSARSKIETLLNDLKSKRKLHPDAQIAFLSAQLTDIPYLHQNGMGEGDWQASSRVYQPHGIHMKQNPVYRLDGLNCQTLVQMVMALYHSNSLSAFDQNYLKIAYGAAGNPNGEIVHYFNRNHFIDADFNPINQKNGWLKDVTSGSPHSQSIHATLTRQRWFMQQRYQMAKNIQVLSDAAGKEMLDHYNKHYSNMNFADKQIVMSYFPKEVLALRQEDDSFKPNQKLLDQIPTPAIAEIVRDPKYWNDYGINVKNIVGTELTVSHLGLLYRQTFRQGELIYNKTTCMPDSHRRKYCEVTPVYCQKKICKELMFTHASNAYPSRYYWYQTAEGKNVCSQHLPKEGQKYTHCNRVVSLPFYDYLTDYQMGYYINMDLRSIVGVHVEKLI